MLKVTKLTKIAGIFASKCLNWDSNFVNNCHFEGASFWIQPHFGSSQKEEDCTIMQAHSFNPSLGTSRGLGEWGLHQHAGPLLQPRLTSCEVGD